jgi:uncharacterized phosphosugar-binding protein
MSRQVGGGVAATGWTRAAIALLEKLDATQGAALDEAAAICATAIGGGGLVHLFGTGHSRMSVEEMFPRYGSYPGFHPMVELSTTFHTQVVGTNGQRQAMFIERVEGLAEVILRNFHLSPPDAMVVFSARGGTRLLDHADVVIDLGTPIGDALVSIDGLATPVGPGSSVAGVAVVNEIKVRTARLLVARGGMPPVLTSGSVVGNEESARLFDAAYDEHARRLARVLAGREEHV